MSAIIDPSLIEAALSTVFDYFKQKVIIKPEDRANLDFIIKGKNEEKIAIEIKSQNVNPNVFKRLSNVISKYNEIDEFILITPQSPSDKEKTMFYEFFVTDKKAEWLSLNEFLATYGIEINNTKDLLDLQTAAITSKIDFYKNEFIGNDIIGLNHTASLKKNFFDAKNGNNSIGEQFISLRRQFPDSILAKFNDDPEVLKKSLYIGQKYNDAIIVLTDIKNFSTIVSSADPDELNESMSKYYTNARDLVFKYNGILDKFIGDAVLAIFNFPQKEENSYINALKFCADLILLGNQIFDNLLKKMDQAIETGTRIGISNGPIYILNIGSGDIELTFIGDKINFAARLEKNCNIDGILLSNRFYNKFNERYNNLIEKLEIIQKPIDPTDAKGQSLITTAWQVPQQNIAMIAFYTD